MQFGTQYWRDTLAWTRYIHTHTHTHVLTGTKDPQQSQQKKVPNQEGTKTSEKAIEERRMSSSSSSSGGAEPRGRKAGREGEREGGTSAFVAAVRCGD